MSHVDACSSCMTALEASPDPEGVFDALASESKLLTLEDRHALDRLVVANTARDDELRDAVTLALLPGLGEEARAIAERYDPLQLYAATEVLSLLLRRGAEFDDRPSVRGITLRSDGSAAPMGRIVPASAVAAEVARFTGLWARKGDVLLPSSDAVDLSRWLFHAARDQRHLLRHFRVAAPFWRMGLVSRDTVSLVALSPSERIDEPFQRWRPSRRERFEVFCVARRAREDRWTVATFDVAALETAARCAALVASLREAEAILAFFGDVKIARHAHTIGTPAAVSTLGSPAEEAAECRPTYVGTFRSVTFTADSVYLTGAKGSLRAEAERVAFPAA